MTKKCTNFNQVIQLMYEWCFDYIGEAPTSMNRKTYLWFEGKPSVNMQHVIGYNYHVQKVGMRGSNEVLQVARK